LRSLSLILATVAALFGLVTAAFAEPASNEAVKLFPRVMGDFRQTGQIRPSASLATEGPLSPRLSASKETNSSEFAGGEADYVASDGTLLLVQVVRLSQDADAYSFLTLVPRTQVDTNIKITREIGTASLFLPNSVSFFKGPVFVRVTEASAAKGVSTKVAVFARLFADRLEAGEGDVPVLVKHLPRWEEAQERAVYFSRFKSLKDAVANQPVLEAVSSEGDADAVLGNYGNAQLLIVEFNTPQLAGDNDRSIKARIQELKSQGLPVPSAYRKTGNYSVFVFNAPSEQVANELIEQVKYEQLVQWLGDNPNLLERAQRDYYLTTAGVLIAVIKASGLSLLVCLAMGGFLGAFLFSRRRAQQREAEGFSDAGGMLRLNIDDLTPETDPGKLLGPAK